jgi:uncharacterized RDD family membrane protein YckC
MLDTVAQVETPEGIALQLRSAGLVPRALAWAVDAAIRITAASVALAVLALFGAGGTGLYLIFAFVLFWFYPVLFEVLRDGQTPGKIAMNLRVVNTNGTPVTWLASIVRNLLRTIDMLPLFYAFGLISTLVDARSRRIGDIVAGTLVIYTDPPAKQSAAPLVASVWPPLPLRVEERAAIVEFAERTEQLTPERQAELADLLPALTGTGGASAVQRLHGMAAAFLGRSGTL